ncbi:STAS domain-containing protein [Alkalicoccobacillus porphyridii]|nr:STAS domain-containing protein [Alkalicoccobacillus porphyridii]
MKFYEYLKNNLCSLTEEWYNGLDKNKSGVYSSDNSSEVETLKDLNYQFHEIFIEIFNDEKEFGEDSFHKWIEEVTSDQGHLETPLPEIIDEFLRNQQIYLDRVKSFFAIYGADHTFEDYGISIDRITETFRQIVVQFSLKKQIKSKQIIHAQSELITELSSPIIHLNDQISLLPLVGEIDTHRAKVIFTNTINFCAEQRVHCLLLDLSGVPIIDTQVANQLFQLINGLKLVGTQTSLSGVRPEIAQTSIQLGIDFKGYKVYSSIAQALANLDFTTIEIG